MRIVYLLAEDLSEHPGLRHKIEGQISFWCAQGHEVYRVLHEQGIILGPDGREISQKETPKYFQTGKLGLLKRMSWQYRFITEALRKIKPDLTYSRYLFPAPNIGSIKKFSGKLVFEINSNDRSEYLQKSKATGVFNSIFRRRSLSGVDGFVFVTTELSCSKDFQGYSSESIVIGNGVNINDFKFSETVDNDHPQLVFIGSPGQSWHGLDKIKILAEYLEDCTINIVGPKYASCASVWGRVPSNIIFHGYLADEEAQCLLINMDIGIGTLALHRKEMYEACPLKIRQYLAHGLPIIAASRDTDIFGPQQFYLELPNAEDNVSSNRAFIRDFVNKVFGNSALRLQAREYAQKVMARERKEADRLGFFERVIDS